MTRYVVTANRRFDTVLSNQFTGFPAKLSELAWIRSRLHFSTKKAAAGKTDYSPLNRFQLGQLYLRRRETKPIAPRPSKIIEDGSGTASVPVKVKFKSLGVDTPLEALAKLEDESVLSKAPFKFRS